ncbi:WavQ [Shewanella sp. S1-58-MNA-CIBAN-0166]|uniref:WavQ n=1 Tax=Shewanella sp. S1-58-MNA-CIBAN-0166 TaxID=3140467 RepID=UPI00332C6E6F
MMKNTKFYVYAPSYNENSGGSVVLHRLCHLLNEIDGVEAFLIPRVLERLNVYSLRSFLVSVKYALINRFTLFNTNNNWNTPIGILNDVRCDTSAITVYPEVTHGNPLRAKNVVRWFLHQPGHFNNEFCFGKNELYFKFNTAIKDFDYCYSKVSSLELKVIYYPLDYYYEDPNINKSTDCHIIRKGKCKSFCHEDSSILLDGKSHKEIGDIFRQSKRFLSYDDYTAYSIFAILSGCESIVIPGYGVTKNQWYPDEKDRYGIAYGISKSELSWAAETKNKVFEHVHNEHAKSEDNVRLFVKECLSFFYSDKDGDV